MERCVWNNEEGCAGKKRSVVLEKIGMLLWKEKSTAFEEKDHGVRKNEIVSKKKSALFERKIACVGKERNAGPKR